jgi:hypothetical protein
MHSHRLNLLPANDTDGLAKRYDELIRGLQKAHQCARTRILNPVSPWLDPEARSLNPEA